jgi:hypothetical protein
LLLGDLSPSLGGLRWLLLLCMPYLCMQKLISILGLSLAFVLPAQAQFLKGVMNSVKNTVQNRAYDTTRSATNKLIDKATGKGKKTTTSDATASTGNNSGNTAGNGAATGAAPGTANSANGSAASAASGGLGGSTSKVDDPPSTKGYVRIVLSANRTIVGGKIKITGFSPMYGSLKTVVMTIGGGTAIPAQTLSLKDSGSFSTTWSPAASGHYKLTVTSQDGKAQRSEPIDVYTFLEMDQITTPTREEGQKVMDKLKATVDEAKAGLSANDASKLDDGMQKITKKWTAFSKEMDDLDQAGKGLDGLQRKYGGLPEIVVANVGRISDDFSQESRDLTTGQNATGSASSGQKHEAYDNTVCEYLTMISEVCAAFSTFMNFEGDVVKLASNLAIDKAAPAVAESASTSGGAVTTIVNKEVAKLFTQVNLDAESFTSMSGTAGFAGDMVQLCSNFLLKTYCVVLDGDLQETYTCTYYNKEKAVWWKYRYTTGATITLRYPKGKSAGGVIKMKGNIEGNATKFTIFTDVNEQDEFRENSKGRVHAEGICVYAPPAAPFVSSQADRKTGFGAAARALFTPACFNIPVDVDYDVDAKTMKFTTNDALIDFSPTVKFTYFYWGIAAGIPLVTIVDLPINKVELTLGKAFSINSTFPVIKDASNNISVKGDADAKVGNGPPHDHDIKFSFTAKGN